MKHGRLYASVRVVLVAVAGGASLACGAVAHARSADDGFGIGSGICAWTYRTRS